jgi:hypothetical protein
MARTIFAILTIFLSFSCTATQNVSFGRVQDYSVKIVALGEKTTELGTAVDANIAAGISKETTGLELLLALQQALPIILARRSSLQPPATLPSRENQIPQR